LLDQFDKRSAGCGRIEKHAEHASGQAARDRIQKSHPSGCQHANRLREVRHLERKVVGPFSPMAQRGGKQRFAINRFDEFEACLTHLEECHPHGRTFFDGCWDETEAGAVCLRRGRGIADHDTDVMNAQGGNLRKGRPAHGGASIATRFAVAFRPVAGESCQGLPPVSVEQQACARGERIAMMAVHARRPSAGLFRALPVVAVVVGSMALWEILKAVLGIPDFKLPHTYAILGELFRRTGRGELWVVALGRNALVTGGEAVAGFLLGGAAGFLIAVLFTQWPFAEQGLLPYVVASQTVPILAIAPMIVVWLGTGWFSKAIIASYLTFFPVTINVLRGLRAVEPDALDLMSSYGATEAQTFLKLRLPTSVPYLFTALRISATASVIGAIIGELPVGSAMGLGVVIINAAQYYTFRPTNLWASILIAAILGIVFYFLVVAAEQVLVRGRRASTEADIT
jgi:NitT/TauT family transport system permease protein